jgi:hypothetical protein
MSNTEVNGQGRIRHVLYSKQTRESLSDFRTCATCGRLCKRTYCSVSCYRAKQRSQPSAERFWAKVQKGAPDACWPWTGNAAGGRNGGRYGQFTITVGPNQQRHLGAHVYAYELTYGPVPDGLEVLHACDRAICCNPAHLSAGTHAENVRQAVERGRHHVPRPNKQKVSDGQVETMLAMRASGLQIAAHFDVTKSLVSQICRGLRRQYRQRPVLEKAS